MSANGTVERDARQEPRAPLSVNVMFLGGRYRWM